MLGAKRCWVHLLGCNKTAQLCCSCIVRDAMQTHTKRKTLCKPIPISAQLNSKTQQQQNPQAPTQTTAAKAANPVPFALIRFCSAACSAQPVGIQAHDTRKLNRQNATWRQCSIWQTRQRKEQPSKTNLICPLSNLSLQRIREWQECPTANGGSMSQLRQTST